MTGIPHLPPPPDVDRLRFRRSLIDESAASASLSSELRFLTPRLPAVAGILKFYPEIYLGMVAERERNGTSPALEKEALGLAADIATVMHSLRSREDLIEAMGQVDRLVPPPLVEVDQLFSALLLLAGGDDYLAVMPELLLDSAEMVGWMDTPAVKDFIDSIENAGD